METVFDDAATAQARSVRAILDPGNDEGPLGQWKAEVLATLREQVGLVLTQLTEVAANVAAGDARAEIFKLTSLKGQGFEDQLHPLISMLATRHGDLAEQVGHQPGSAGTKRGDELITLAEFDTGGRCAAFVFEAKHRKLSMRKIMAELDEAMENRAAAAAVVVFAEPAQSPTAVPFTYFANKAIVTLDPDSPADRVLELAYMWARWEARQGTHPRRIHARRRVRRGRHGRSASRPGADLDDPAVPLHGQAADRGCLWRGRRVPISDVDAALCALALELR